MRDTNVTTHQKRILTVCEILTQRSINISHQLVLATGVYKAIHGYKVPTGIGELLHEHPRATESKYNHLWS